MFFVHAAVSASRFCALLSGRGVCAPGGLARGVDRKYQADVWLDFVWGKCGCLRALTPRCVCARSFYPSMQGCAGSDPDAVALRACDRACDHLGAFSGKSDKQFLAAPPFTPHFPFSSRSLAVSTARPLALSRALSLLPSLTPSLTPSLFLLSVCLSLSLSLSSVNR